MDPPLKHTALYPQHRALKARMAPFAGYHMPISYRGIVKEHQRVRRSAGLFDVSHMGEFMVTGPGAGDFLQYLTINDLGLLQTGQAQYSAMCYPDGGIVDDLVIYRRGEGYLLVVNAANIDQDWAWLEEHRLPRVSLGNLSAETSLIALQGPRSREILSQLSGEQVAQLDFYHFSEGKVAGYQTLIARTGYTGELGFELYGSDSAIAAIWEALLETGDPAGLAPVGLGCRDTLRLEMRYCLYGNDIDATTNPIEAGLGWVTKLDKGDFIGKTALLKARQNLTRRLVCIEMTERAVPRPGYRCYVGPDPVGTITSGTQSPSLGIGIALAYVQKQHSSPGTALEVDIRGSRKAARVVKPPFYRQGTAHL